MNATKILEELDKLKLLIMTDEAFVDSDVYKFDMWVEAMQGRDKYSLEEPIFIPKKYNRYSSIRTLVDDLYHRKYGKSKEYAKNQPEIRKMIATIVAMTLFIEEQI